MELKEGRFPRFNMPFELGIVIGWQRWRETDHRYFVLDADRDQQEETLSDLKGADVAVHGNQPQQILRELLNIFPRVAPRPTAEQLWRIYERLTASLERIKALSWSSTVFDAAPFQDLVMAATVLTGEVVAESAGAS